MLSPRDCTCIVIVCVQYSNSKKASEKGKLDGAASSQLTG